MSEQISRPEGAPAPSGRARLEPPDISERGGQKGGQPQRSDERLFVQLTAYGECRDVGAVCSQLGAAGIDAVVYEDLNDARGIALLAIHRDPNFFLDTLRPVLNAGACAALTRKPEFTLFGRTYALGYEPDLDEVLFARPRRTVLNPAWRWAIWYPLRRNGAFARLPIEQQRVILAEHGEIGMRFGAADYVHDVRLACHGLDKEDNDFVIGLIGKELHPLSAVVEAMRKTQQTSLYLDRLGPFFVGRTIWQAAE
jgi:chlorite dismutase